MEISKISRIGQFSKFSAVNSFRGWKKIKYLVKFTKFTSAKINPFKVTSKFKEYQCFFFSLVFSPSVWYLIVLYNFVHYMECIHEAILSRFILFFSCFLFSFRSTTSCITCSFPTSTPASSCCCWRFRFSSSCFLKLMV